MSKKSFVLYTEYIEQIKMLSLEQRGILLTAIFSYELEEELPEMDALTTMAFSFIKNNLDRDDAKWEETKQKRSEAGRKGGIAKASKAKQTLANVSKGKQNLANVAVNVNDNVNVNVNDNDVYVVGHKKNKNGLNERQYDYGELEKSLLAK